MTAPIDRAREFDRAWKAAAPKLAAALPDTVDPDEWLPPARATLILPQFAGCKVPALIRVAMAAARDGVAMTPMMQAGLIHLSRTGVPHWVLRWGGLATMVNRVTGQMMATASVVRDGDRFDVFRTRAGTGHGGIDQIIHVAVPEEGTREWTHVFARTAPMASPMKRHAVLTRHEVEEAHARLKPKGQAKLEDFGRLLVLAEAVGHLPIEHPTWPPAARLLAAADRINPPVKPRKARPLKEAA